MSEKFVKNLKIEPRLIRNRAKCLLCGEIIESKRRHDWVACKCGEIFIDGGLDYVHAGAKDWNNFVDLSEYEYVYPDSVINFVPNTVDRD